MRSFIELVYEMVSIFVKKRVPRSAAEFSFFLTLSIFPLLICLTAMLSSLNINEQSLLMLLQGVLPEDVISVLSEYIRYVTENYSDGMLIAGLTVMITSSAGAVRSMINIMADIQGEVRYKGISGLFVNFVFSIVFLFTFYLAMIILMTGGWFINMMDSFFGIHRFAYLWQWLRFIVLFIIMIMLVNFLYKFVDPKREKAKLSRVIGALVATVSIVVFSILFSMIISFSSKYSVVYGSLSAIIVLMVWCYTCGTILIMGNVLNIVLKRRKVHRLKEAGRSKNI